MTENRAASGSFTGSPSISFTPVPYRADGVVSFGSGLQLIGILGLLGMILGVLASVVSKFFYLVLLFPIIIGGCIGAAGSKCIKWFHVRNPLLCGTAGFFAGCLAMFTMHYTDFKMFEANVNKWLGDDAPLVRGIALRIDEIHAHWDEASEQEQAIVAELEKNPESLQAIQTNSVWKYLDLTAHQGVEINRGGAGAKGRGLNLGYTGSYIYWGVEALIVAGIAYSLMTKAASEPYCGECQGWKTAQLYGPFADSPELSRNIGQGTLTRFASHSETAPADGMVTVFTCPHCQSQGEADVRVERWTVNKKGETTKKRLIQMTYPAEAIPVLQAICTPPEPAPEADTVSSESPTDA